MEKKNITPIVIAIVAILAVLGAGIAIKFSQGSTDSKSESTKTKTEESQTNPASKIEAPEIEITDANFEAEVKNYKGVVLVDMFSPTCPHCQNIGPVITEIAKENAGKYKVGKLNVYTSSKTATDFAIESVPALIFFKDGVEAKRLVGEQGKEKILTTLEEIAK